MRLSEVKCRRSNVKDMLVNYLAGGLAKVYKINNHLEKFSGCTWDRFKEIHKRLMKDLTFEEKKLVLTIGIHEIYEERDIILLCNKFGIKYKPAGYPKWSKDGSQEKAY